MYVLLAKTILVPIFADQYNVLLVCMINRDGLVKLVMMVARFIWQMSLHIVAFQAHPIL